MSAAEEALRIVRRIQADFPTGPSQGGSAFLAPRSGLLMTCAHVVVNDRGEAARRVMVTAPDGARYEASVHSIERTVDLASLTTTEAVPTPTAQDALPSLGEEVVFAGCPQGVQLPSVFPGMVSATGTGLVPKPKCETIQVAGMINNGNSGGPLLNTSGQIIGIVTAKYVPLLQEIDKLRGSLEAIPQFPRDVSIGQVDFSAFVNLTIRSMWQLAAVLKLVQVGTGWAVPTRYFSDVGGR